MSLRREKLTLVRTCYKDGNVQGVVVMTLDRLTRHASDLLTLQEEMGLHNATLYSIKETGGHLHQSVLARFVEHQHRDKQHS